MEGIKYVCPRGTSGYSEAAKDYIIALYKKKIPITVSLKVFDNTSYQEGERNNIVNSLTNKKIKYDKLIIHTTPEYWEHIINEHKKFNTEVIGITVWETDKLHPKWIPWLNQVDKIIVPCRWNKTVLQECNIIKPIEVIPHIYKPLTNIKSQIIGINKDDFIFYTIGQWTIRKGIEETIRAYLNVFTKKDKVCLLIKTFHSTYNNDQKQIIRDYVEKIMNEYRNPAKVILLLEEFTDKQICALHTIGHCYISLCKAEGFGLGMFDAAGMGKPVICTGYGGQTDFIKNWLIDYELIPVKGMEWISWYLEEQNWAMPNIKHAEVIIRWVYDHYDIAKSFAIMQQANIKDNFNSNVIADKFIKFLKKWIIE
jgi:glycosyltransferase involved in cell wall biosynthesis